MTRRKYTLPAGDGFKDYLIPDQEMCDRALQARMQQPTITVRQARSRALGAARKARDLNELFLLSPDEPLPAEEPVSMADVLAWPEIAKNAIHLRRCFRLNS